MTIPTSAEVAGPLTLPTRLGALAAVAVARVLVLLPPARLARVLTALRRGARPADPDMARAARRATVTVSARCAGLGCLQRSVATVLICRARGRWPDWCTGFRTRPFAAHAWVEVGGAPVGEPEGLSVFTTVLAVRAEGIR